MKVQGTRLRLLSKEKHSWSLTETLPKLKHNSFKSVSKGPPFLGQTRLHSVKKIILYVTQCAMCRPEQLVVDLFVEN